MVAYAYYLDDTRVRREAESLVHEGFQVDCYSLRKKGQPKSEKVHDVNIFRLPATKYRGSSKVKYVLSYISFFILSFFAITVSYSRRRYHVIQFHTLPDFIILAGIVPRLFGARLVLDMHEIAPEFFMSKFKVSNSHPFTKILKFIEKTSIHFSDAVIVVNDPIKRVLVERCRPKSNVTVIMNCADDRLFYPDRHSNLSNGRGFNLIYHGTLTPLYGLEIAIRAVAKLEKQIPLLKLMLFGDGAEVSDLKKIAEELHIQHNVLFMGRVPIEKVPEYINQADLGILTIIRDEFVDLSFSNKLAEYVCTKTPVVATRLKSTLEYFPEDCIAYFNSEDLEDLAAKIYELYISPNKRISQAEKAFQHYQKIGWQVMRKRYIELIESLIPERSHPCSGSEKH